MNPEPSPSAPRWSQGDNRLMLVAGVLGILGILLATLFQDTAYQRSRSAVEKTIYRSNLALARALADLSSAPALQAQTNAPANIGLAWQKMIKPFPDSFLCVMDRDARLLTHTLRPDTVGDFVGDMTFIPDRPGGPTNLSQLIETKSDWSGRNMNLAGFEQLVAFAYAPSLGGLVAVHVPASVVDDEIEAASLPWFLATGALGGLIPASVALLLFVAQRSRARLINSHSALAESKAGYQDLFDHAPVMYAVTDCRTGSLVECNDALLHALGAKRAEVTGQPLTEWFHSESRPAFQELLTKIQRASQPEEVELVLLPRTGEPRDVALTSTAIKDSDGRIIRGRIALRDITVSKQAARRVAEAHANLECAQALSHVGNWEYRVRDGRIQWSDELYRIFGLEPQSVTMTYERLLKMIHPEDRDRHDAYTARLNAAKPGEKIKTLEYRVLHRDGRISHVSVEVEIQFDDQGKSERWVGTVQDITGRKQAELALHESEERLQIVTEYARVGLVMVSPDRHYLFANAAYAEILGLSTADIIGKRVPDVLGGVYEKQIGPRLDRAFAGERVAYELLLPSPDSEHHYAVKYEPIREGDVVARVVVVIVDITERKRSEEALRRSEADLQLALEAARMGQWDWNIVTGQVTWTAWPWPAPSRPTPPLPARG